MSTNEWNYDQLDNIYFQKTENELECLRGQSMGYSPKRASSGLGQIAERAYKGDKGKFLKSLQECLNWQEPENEIADQYTSLMRIGQQPDLMKLTELETIDEHVEWKQDRNTKRKEREHKEKVKREIEAAQQKKHLQWKKEQEQKRVQMKLNNGLLEMLNDSRVSAELDRQKRMVTFDLASETRESIKPVTPPMQQLQLINLKAEVAQKNSPSKISERSEMTAATSFTSNSRYHHTPSPTKFKRDNKAFRSIGNTIMNTPSLNFSNMDIDTDDFKSTQGTISPDVNKRGFMPGQSLFDFRNQTITDMNATTSSARSIRGGFSPIKRNRQVSGSQFFLRQTTLKN